MSSHQELVDLNCTLLITERQLSEAREVLRRLHGQVQDPNGHAGWLTVAKEQERELAYQIDGLLRRSKGMRRFASRGIPLGPLLGSRLNITLSRSFRQSAERSFRALLNSASDIL